MKSIFPQEDLFGIIVTTGAILLGTFLYLSKTIAGDAYTILCLAVLLWPISRVIIMLILLKNLKATSIYDIWDEMKKTEELLAYNFPEKYIPKAKQIYPEIGIALIYLDPEDLAYWNIKTPTPMRSVALMYDITLHTMLGTRPDLGDISDAERWMHQKIGYFGIKKRRETLAPKTAVFQSYDTIETQEE